MRDLFAKLLSDSHFNTGIKITPFSGAHIIYMLLIFGTAFLLYFLFRNKDAQKKVTVLRVLAYLLIISYVSDFFVHEFVYDSGYLNMDKLPFHVCTVLCPLVGFVQFNNRFKKFREPVVMLSMIAPLMYLCYPASVGDGEPWCYQAVQTMFYHGTLFVWGVLSVAFGEVKPDIKKSWHGLVLLVGITLWAKLGNVLMDHNWFFLEEDAFYIGLVAGGIIPKWLLMIINPVVFFLAVLACYGVVYLIRFIKGKIASKKLAPVKESEQVTE